MKEDGKGKEKGSEGENLGSKRGVAVAGRGDKRNVLSSDVVVPPLFRDSLLSHPTRIPTSLSRQLKIWSRSHPPVNLRSPE